MVNTLPFFAMTGLNETINTFTARRMTSGSSEGLRRARVNPRMKKQTGKVATSDQQPAALGARGLAAATQECVNSQNTIQANSIKSRPVSTGSNTPARLLLKVGETAQILGISTVSVRRLIARGELAVNRKLRHVLIPRTEIERFANGGDR
jgi:excisionase family DNA binding protein